MFKTAIDVLKKAHHCNQITMGQMYVQEYVVTLLLV